MQKLIVSAAASVLLAACGSPARIQETATSVPQRDLTLSPSVTETQVASKIELAVPATTHQSKPSRTVTRARVHVAAKSAVVSPAPAPAPTPAPELVASVVAPTPTSVAASPPPDPNSHELAPGATVTIVPVSTASASPNGGSDWSEIPSPRPGGGVTISGWGGGHCGSGGRDHGGRGPVSILQ